MIFKALVKVLAEDGFNIRGIFERNDVGIRRLEGMEENKGFFKLDGLDIPDSTEVTIVENGIKYYVDFENGQKTGFFLDQKFNRRAAAKLAKGRRVLDCFTHTGSFALNCAYGGAEHVCAVDISEEAVGFAKRNAELNGLEDKMSFKAVNVLICCLIFQQQMKNMIMLFLTRLLLQNLVQLLIVPFVDIKK